MKQCRMKTTKIEKKTVDTYKKIEDKFVDTFLEENDGGSK